LEKTLLPTDLGLAEGHAAASDKGKGPRLLSSREQEVLQWVARGKTAPEIGCILGISKRTVDFHVNSAVEKLNAANRIHAVAIAIQNLVFTI
jgi:DNA-binding CsgD family transcriptional regulator